MKECKIDDCDVEVMAKDMCSRHYYRNLRRGSPHISLNVKSYDRYDKQGNRWCTWCSEYLSPDSFTGNKTWCKACRQAYRYGITRQEMASLLDGTLCPICETRTKNVIDHDHSCCPGRQSCGKCIRGALCRPCNATLENAVGERKKKVDLYLLNYESGKVI